MSEGAPIGFLWWALPTQLRAVGVSIGDITALTSALALPWALKFFWAPLIDTLQTSRWSLRSWIISAQLLMGASLLPLLNLDLDGDFSFLFACLMVHAVAAATQDVSIDALCISTTSGVERGSVNGWMQAGMLSGRAVFGGGTLLLAQTWGSHGFILILVTVIWSTTLLLAISKLPAGRSAGRASSERVRGFAATVVGAVKRKSTWFGLLFAGIGGAGFEAVGAVAGPFMIDRGLTSTQVGVFFSLPSIVGMIIGALIGGAVSDWLGRRKAVGIFLSALAASIFVLAWFDAAGDPSSGAGIFLLLALVYFCIGLFTASSYALFMDITDPRLGATQFSAFMGVTNLCESWSGFAIGRMIPIVGYPAGMAIMGVISLASLPLLPAMSAKSNT